MCEWVTTSMAIASIGMQTMGKYQEGVMANQYYNTLAASNEEQAKRILATSEVNRHLVQDAAKEAGKLQSVEGSRNLAAQRVAFAANGIGAGSITAEALAKSGYDKTKMDEAAIRYNADAQTWAMENEANDEAWALRTEAGQYRMAGKQARRAGNIGAFSSLLGGASQFSSAFAPRRGLTGGKAITSRGIEVPSYYKPLR